MKHKSVGTIAAFLCGCFLAFVPARIRRNGTEISPANAEI